MSKPQSGLTVCFLSVALMNGIKTIKDEHLQGQHQKSANKSQAVLIENPVDPTMYEKWQKAALDTVIISNHLHSFFHQSNQNGY